ncbi:MAG: helix-turn-helix transcriptional regulator [Anaerolineae bacterium]|nr:helix-turn-helix transcriptional regulator [Anaerolineae bacterium]
MEDQNLPASIDTQELTRQIRDYLCLQYPQALAHQRQAGVDFEVDECRYHLTVVAVPPQGSITLSPREREIIHLVAEGHPNKTIGKLLDISPWTVATHVKRIFTKLNVSSRSEMIAHVMKYGLVAPRKPEL